MSLTEDSNIVMRVIQKLAKQGTHTHIHTYSSSKCLTVPLSSHSLQQCTLLCSSSVVPLLPDPAGRTRQNPGGPISDHLDPARDLRQQTEHDISTPPCSSMYKHVSVCVCLYTCVCLSRCLLGEGTPVLVQHGPPTWPTRDM